MSKSETIHVQAELPEVRVTIEHSDGTIDGPHAAEVREIHKTSIGHEVTVRYTIPDD